MVKVDVYIRVNRIHYETSHNILDTEVSYNLRSEINTYSLREVQTPVYHTLANIHNYERITN
jgi:hypothetical protein